MHDVQVLVNLRRIANSLEYELDQCYLLSDVGNMLICTRLEGIVQEIRTLVTEIEKESK